ncbi:MAG: rhodanese-like domain-containing protein, partial [Verrucomicrobium sp.]|nr:rhodanese-like domain-containing protein [Verrucomicrobium sp.]
DPECPVCGDHPTITEPIDYQGFCGLPSITKDNASSDSPHTSPMSSPTPDVPAVTVQELHAMQQAGEDFYLLDVREPYEAEIAVIPGATLIPLGQLPDRVDEVPKDKKVVIHCRSGMRSAKALGILQEHGYQDLWNVTGGVLAWSDEVDPSVAKY